MKEGCGRLNLGCGARRLDDCVNVDVTDRTSPDVVHDLNRFPWPFADGQFEEVLAYDVLEHLDDVVRVMEEIHRVCKSGACVRITVPHYSCVNSYRDPTHRHHFSRFSFAYFTKDHPLAFYSQCRFEERAAAIIFLPGLINRVIGRLARKFPDGYERRWAWLFPAWFLYFELTAVTP